MFIELENHVININNINFTDKNEVHFNNMRKFIILKPDSMKKLKKVLLQYKRKNK